MQFGKDDPNAWLDDDHDNPGIDLQQQVTLLAGLTPLEYDQQRDAAARRLGVRAVTLDKEVAKLRSSIAEEASVEVVEEISPWDDPVDGAGLLNNIARTISRHVILPTGAIVALSVWALGSFCMDAWRVWPKLLITSPEKRCGKSTLLEAMEGVVYRALLTSNITPSAVFRSIEEWSPTLLIDEADTFAKNNDELNGVINAGHTRRTAVVIRTEKQDDGFKPVKFSVWCPQVISGIGEQRDTLHDRSIHIEMRRKLPGERSCKLPAEYYEQQVAIRRRCLRWAEDNAPRLKNTSIQAPACCNDRAQDNWTPLFAMAAIVGDDWPERISSAYLTFNALAERDSDNAGVLLLRDIQEIFKHRNADKIPSAELVDLLVAHEDRPWFEWRRGKPLTQNSLSRLLKPYHITPGTIRMSDHYTPKGFKLSSFNDAFTRYLSISPQQTATSPQPLQGEGYSPI